MSLHPQTSRVRLQIQNWQKSGRKHWDLHRHILNPYVMMDALKLVIKNKGSAGVDRQTVHSIQGKEWEFINELIAEMKSGAYKPSAVRRVYIPKKDGNQRPLGIPTLKDRVLQRAMVLVMEPIYESIFLDFSYGFRPNRKARDCAWVVPRVHKLIWEFLKSGFIEMGKPWTAQKKGTPQGGPISPLLSNIYLHYLLDVKFQEVFGGNPNVAMTRYADDFVILATKPEDAKVIERWVRLWLYEAGLNLKENKTKWVDMRNHKRSHKSKFNFLGFKFHLRSFRDNAKRFWVARQPSESSRKALHESIKSRLHVGMKTNEVRQRMFETWLGWGEYFKYSNGNRIIHREMRSVRKIGMWWLTRKFRRQRKAIPKSLLMKWNKEMTNIIEPIKVIPDLTKGDQLRLVNL